MRSPRYLLYVGVCVCVCVSDSEVGRRACSRLTCSSGKALCIVNTSQKYILYSFEPNRMLFSKMLSFLIQISQRSVANDEK